MVAVFGWDTGKKTCAYSTGRPIWGGGVKTPKFSNLISIGVKILFNAKLKKYFVRADCGKLLLMLKILEFRDSAPEPPHSQY